MRERINRVIRRGAVDGRTVFIYILLWLLGVPGLLLLLLFVLGVGR